MSMPLRNSDLDLTGNQQILIGLSFLEKLSATAKECICGILDDISEETLVAEGENILREGHLGFGAGYILLEGKVELERPCRDAVELDAPVVLGEISRFSQDDVRTATVDAKSDGKLIRFSWDELYSRAEKELSEEDNRAFRHAVEGVVWERQDLHDIPKLSLFNDLDDELRVRVCTPLPWIGKLMKLSEGEKLFDAESRCRSRGFILLKGSVSLEWSGSEKRVVSAPSIIGIMPNNKPERQWSASAKGAEDTDLLAFSWLNYSEALQGLLSRDELKLLFDSFSNNRKRFFWN